MPSSGTAAEQLAITALGVELIHLLEELAVAEPPSYAQNAVISCRLPPVAIDASTTATRFFAFLTANPGDYGLRSFDQYGINPVVCNPNFAFRPVATAPVSSSPFSPSAFLQVSHPRDQDYMVIVFREHSPSSDVLVLRFFALRTRKTLPHYDHQQAPMLVELAQQVEAWFTRLVRRALDDDHSLRLWRVLCDPSLKITVAVMHSIPEYLHPVHLKELDPHLVSLFERNRIDGPSFINHMHSVYGGVTGLCRHIRSADPNVHHLLLYSAEAPDRFILHVVTNNLWNTFEAYSCRRRIHSSDFARNPGLKPTTPEQDDELERVHVSRFINAVCHYLWRNLIFSFPTRQLNNLFEVDD